MIKLFLSLDYLSNATVTVRCFWTCQASQLNRLFMSSNELLCAIDFTVLFLALENIRINKSHKASVSDWRVFSLKTICLFLFITLFNLSWSVSAVFMDFRSIWTLNVRYCDMTNEKAACGIRLSIDWLVGHLANHFTHQTTILFM